MVAHLVFVPAPGAGHLFSAIELAKLLVQREQRLTVSILIMTRPRDTKTESVHDHRINYVHLSHDGYAPTKPSYSSFIEYHKPQVRNFLAKSAPLAGVVLDMFCVTMADEIDDVPRYIFFMSGAGYLCLLFHALDHDLSQFKDSDSAELVIPGFVNSVPAKVLSPELTGAGVGGFSKLFLSWAAKLKDVKGILVNTCFELQPHAITYLSENHTVPPVYPVGPLLKLKGGASDDPIISWLDNQPESSVLFLCFGSAGFFDVDQLAEIARALDNTGTRFLWSIRRPPTKGGQSWYTDGGDWEYEDLTEVLPKGFLENTANTGRVIDWAPQTVVLSHPAVGGFITHCGWNSCLESIWFGVPVATWPHNADQQSNAFELVKEMEIAVELKLDYKRNYGTEANFLVSAEEIENAIKQLMKVSNTNESSIKQKVKDISMKSRMSMAKGGSSYAYLDNFIEEVIGGSNLTNLNGLES